MVIDLDNFKNDTINIISDWAETCIIAKLNTIYDKGGFTSINKFISTPFILFDDFADNKFENRDFLNYPEWLVNDGTWTAINGYLQKTATADAWHNLYVAETNFDNMVWEFSVTLADVGWDNGAILALSDQPDIIGDLGNGYYLWITGAWNITLYRVEAGVGTVTVFESVWTADLNRHKFKFSRQSGGLWEVFMDGTSLGTGTDNFFTSMSYLNIYSWGIGEQIDNIGVYRYSDIWPNNKVTLDFQPLTSSDRYIIKEMGMSAVNMFAVYAPTTITIKDDDYIFRYIQNGDLGTNGVGSLNILTDSSKSWVTNEWEGFHLIDNDGTFFEIVSNTSTALTISGTPVSGQYYITESYIVRNIEKNEDHFRILVEHQSKEH